MSSQLGQPRGSCLGLLGGECVTAGVREEHSVSRGRKISPDIIRLEKHPKCAPRSFQSHCPAPHPPHWVSQPNFHCYCKCPRQVKKNLFWSVVQKTQGQEVTVNNGFPAARDLRPHRAAPGEIRNRCVCFPLAFFPFCPLTSSNPDHPPEALMPEHHSPTLSKPLLSDLRIRLLHEVRDKPCLYPSSRKCVDTGHTEVHPSPAPSTWENFLLPQSRLMEG